MNIELRFKTASLLAITLWLILLFEAYRANKNTIFNMLALLNGLVFVIAIILNKARKS